MRKSYIDNLRWVTVLLVLVYHVCYLFNGLSVFGGISTGKSLLIGDLLISLVYPWFMVLLFAVAGVSARYSLEKRTGKEFIRERGHRLLVPSTMGILVYQWLVGYMMFLNSQSAGEAAMPENVPGFVIYIMSVLMGMGPLWFAHLLYLYSLILVLLRKLDKKDWFWTKCAAIGVPVLILLAVPVWASGLVLNMPVVTVYRIGIYFVAFLIGYFVLSHEEVQQKLSNAALPLLGLALAGAVAYGWRYWGKNYAEPACLYSVLTNVYLWLAVLAAFGCFKRYFDKETALTRYMSKISFGVYVLHYPALLLISIWLEGLGLPVAVKYLAALVLGSAATLGLYELLRRIPVLRYWILGIKKKRNLAKSK